MPLQTPPHLPPLPGTLPPCPGEPASPNWPPLPCPPPPLHVKLPFVYDASKPTLLCEMANDILVHVFGFLHIRERFFCSRLCHAFHGVLKSKALWWRTSALLFDDGCNIMTGSLLVKLFHNNNISPRSFAITTSLDVNSSALFAFRHLRHLHLDNLAPPPSDDDQDYMTHMLSSLTHLETLELRDNQTSTVSFPLMPHLRSFTWRGPKGGSLVNINNLPALTSLEVQADELTHLDGIEELPLLQSVTLRIMMSVLRLSKPSRRVIDTVARCAQITELRTDTDGYVFRTVNQYVEDNNGGLEQILRAEVEPVASPRPIILHHLQLFDCTTRSVNGIGGITMRQVAERAPNLRVLRIPVHEMTAVLTTAIGALHSLRELCISDIEGVDIKDEHMAPLRTLSQLQSLELRGFDTVSDSGFAHLGTLSCLHTLRIINTRTLRGVTHVCECEHLRTLEVRYSDPIEPAYYRFTEADSLGLARLSALRELLLDEVEGDKAFKNICTFLPQLLKLHIHWGSWRLSADAWSHARALTSLVELGTVSVGAVWPMVRDGSLSKLTTLRCFSDWRYSAEYEKDCADVGERDLRAHLPHMCVFEWDHRSIRRRYVLDGDC